MSTPQSEYLRIGLLALLIAVIACIAVSPSLRPEANVAPESKSSHLAPVVEPIKSGASPAAQTEAQIAGDWDYIDGMKHFDAGRYREALACFNRAVSSNKKNAYALYRRGLAYWNLNDSKAALADFDQAIALNAANKEFYDSRIELYREQKAFDKALADDELIVKNIGDRADVRHSMALTLYQSGAYEKALKVLDDAMKAFPKDTYSVNLRGRCHEGLKQPDKAIADYNEALAMDKNYADSLNNRGVLYLERKEYNKALDDFNAIVRSNQATGRTYYNRSLVCDELGKNVLAEADRKKYKSLKYDPGKDKE